jgi:hypothetical protein
MLDGFTATDRLLAIALAKYEADLCPGCGWPRKFSTHKDAENHWTAPPARRCHACTANEKGREAYKDARYPSALQHRTVPTDALWSAISDPTFEPPDHGDYEMGATGLVYTTPDTPEHHHEEAQ